ncbi:tyrosine-type recombinase/integrase [Microbacterium sp.]|uniref:tyrosine-type recombinase/integrase n=1 Tax=Microbacterium sp. TaxID=51671 RepID=UPI003C77F30B
MTRRAKTPARRTPNSTGTVQQLPSGNWRAFYRIDGRRISAPRTFPSKDAARDWLAGEFADRARGTWTDPTAGRITLTEYADSWLETRLDLSRSTRVRYRGIIDRWFGRRVGASADSRGVDLGGMHVADITTATVRAWLTGIRAEVREQAERNAVPIDRRHPARAWARAQGMDVPATGKLSRTVLDAWRAAGSPVQDRTGTAPENVGKSTSAHAYRLLHGILSTAVGDGLIVKNPAQVRGAGQDAAAERPIATPQEVETIAAHMPRRLQAAVIVAAWSSARQGELFALARRHVDLDAGTIRIERSLDRDGTFKEPKTVKSRRTVYLPEFVTDRLREHMVEFTGEHPDALLFTQVNGGPVGYRRLGDWFRRARKVAGRDDLHWHDLRHVAASLAYRAGASVPEVQRRLGHTTARAASIYAHVYDDSDRLIAERLNAAFAPTDTPRLRAV